MGRIPEDTVREIRDRADIVGLIGRYVELKKAGRNYKGLCPFHGEKTPSFNVNPDKQIFRCFGCNEGGDAIAFLMRHDGLTFPEAARTLAKDCGIEIAESESGPPGVTEKIFSANDLAQSLYSSALNSDEGAGARDYLARRGLHSDAIVQFGIGYAPDRWDAVERALARAGISADIGEQSGLLAPRRGGVGQYDRLRGRVTFPIQDARGRVIGFGGRALGADQEPKYLNTPESPVFQKRRAFYGLPHALEGIRRSERAIVCEGYFDRIALHRGGLPESFATCGTALSAEHGNLLRRRTRQVVLLFDGDAAGDKAVERALEILLPHGLRVKAASLPVGEDPDTYLQKEGEVALRDLVEKAPDALEIVMRRTVARGFATPSAKADAVAHVAPLIARIPNRIERDEYTRRLAMMTDSDWGAVQSVVRSESTARSSDREEAMASIETPKRAAPVDASEERYQHDLAVLLFRHPGLAARCSWERLDQALPDGSWKAVVSRLREEAVCGRVLESGTVDHFAIAEQLDQDAQARLSEVVMSERLADAEMAPEKVLDGLLTRIEKRRIDARMRELTRRMREPGADIDSLLREKKQLMDEAQMTRASL